MPGRMKQGQSIFIPFKNGESIYDSQNKARMYMSEEKFRASFPGWRFGEVDLVEYVPKPRWTSVEERLPEQRDGYLVATEDGDVYDAEFIPGVKQWWVGDDWRLDITHWMPLPELPKEDT